MNSDNSRLASFLSIATNFTKVRNPRNDAFERGAFERPPPVQPHSVFLGQLREGLESVQVARESVQVERAFSDLGITAVLCHETSDRNGPEAFEQSIEENLAFAEAHRSNPDRRGMFGLHASFTLSEDSLKRIAAASSLAAVLVRPIKPAFEAE